MVLERVAARQEGGLTMDVYELREKPTGPLGGGQAQVQVFRVLKEHPVDFDEILDRESFREAQRALEIDIRRASVRLATIRRQESAEGWYLEVLAVADGHDAPDIIEV